MDEEKPWALISEVGEQGYLEEVTDVMKQHFHIVCHRDFSQNPQLYGDKIQAMFVWNCEPAAEPSLLTALPSLKVVANGGVGINHLDVPYISSLGVKVTNTPGVVSDATADMAMALLLASARKVVEGEVKGRLDGDAWASLSYTEGAVQGHSSNKSFKSDKHRGSKHCCTGDIVKIKSMVTVSSLLRSPSSRWPQDEPFTSMPDGIWSHRGHSGDHWNGRHRIQNSSEEPRIWHEDLVSQQDQKVKVSRYSDI